MKSNHSNCHLQTEVLTLWRTAKSGTGSIWADLRDLSHDFESHEDGTLDKRVLRVSVPITLPDTGSSLSTEINVLP